MGRNTIYEYPYWGPANAGPAENFASPSGAIRGPQVKAIEADSLRLGVPQEISESNNYSDVWQWNEIIIPTPQAPVTIPDQFVRSDSLMAYAMSTLGGGLVERSDPRLGNAGERNIING
jgi:hypothetical protein